MSKWEIGEWSGAVCYASLNTPGGNTVDFRFFDLWRVELNAAWYGYRLTTDSSKGAK
jgi:hypothetical protein